MDLLNDLLIPIELYSLSLPFAWWQLSTCSGGLSNINYCCLWLTEQSGTGLTTGWRSLDQAFMHKACLIKWDDLGDLGWSRKALCKSMHSSQIQSSWPIHSLMPCMRPEMKLQCKAPRKAMSVVQQLAVIGLVMTKVSGTGWCHCFAARCACSTCSWSWGLGSTKY